jgi:hypothetical protein
MRRKNWRIVIVGGAMIVLAAAFFLGMLSIAPSSTDPKSLMETVGQVWGVVSGIGLTMIVVGLIGKRTPA